MALGQLSTPYTEFLWPYKGSHGDAETKSKHNSRPGSRDWDCKTRGLLPLQRTLRLLVIRNLDRAASYMMYASAERWAFPPTACILLSKSSSQDARVTMHGAQSTYLAGLLPSRRFSPSPCCHAPPSPMARWPQGALGIPVHAVPHTWPPVWKECVYGVMLSPSG